MRILQCEGVEFKAVCVGDLIPKEGYNRHYFTPDYTIYKIDEVGTVCLLTKKPVERGTLLQQRLIRLSKSRR